MRGAQGERRDFAQVRRRPRVFAFLSAPVDTPTLLPSPSHPSLAVSEATTLESRAPPRSLPSSRRLRSPTSSAPPHPECSLSCQRPLTLLLSHRSHPAPHPQSRAQSHWDRGRLRARCRPQGYEDHQPQVRRCLRDVFDFTSAPVDTRAYSLTAPTHPLQSRGQYNPSRGRLSARCRPQGDDDHQPRVRRGPECSPFCQRPSPPTSAPPFLQSRL